MYIWILKSGFTADFFGRKEKEKEEKELLKGIWNNSSNGDFVGSCKLF